MGTLGLDKGSVSSYRSSERSAQAEEPTAQAGYSRCLKQVWMVDSRTFVASDEGGL